MMNRKLHTLVPLVLLALATTSLSGCFVFLDDDDDDYNPPPPAPVNAVPIFDAGASYWLCDYDSYADDYFFEFQAAVDDADGYHDVQYVDASVFLADDPTYMIDTFSLIYESDGIWGGLVWERESDLFCGEAVDVLFEAWDSYGDKAELLIRY